MYTVYVLRSESSGKLYIGQTGNFPKRLSEHHAGTARYTRGRGPWQLVHTEEFSTRALAMRREKFLKSGKGREELKGLLAGRAGPPEAD